MSKKYQPAGVGMTPSKTELGNFIRTRRLELNLKQVFLAEQVGLTQPLLSLLEVGTRKYFNDQWLVRLAKEFQCDPEELRKRMPVKRVAQPRTELGKLIRSRREELGLTLEDFAKKMNMTRKQAKRLEIGGISSISYELVKPLANTLDINPSVLTGFTGRDRKPAVGELGRLVRARRKELAISTNQLAGELDVSPQFVNQIELGQRRLSESNDLIERLAKVLQLDINELQSIRPTRKLKQVAIAPNSLGGFLAARRLELHLTQREVGERAETAASIVSNLERGKIHPGPSLLDRMAKALDYQIPQELVTLSRELRLRGPKTHPLPE